MYGDTINRRIIDHVAFLTRWGFLFFLISGPSQDLLNRYSRPSVCPGHDRAKTAEQIEFKILHIYLLGKKVRLELSWNMSQVVQWLTVEII